MYLTNRNRCVIQIYNSKSVTKVHYDRPGSISVSKFVNKGFSVFVNKGYIVFVNKGHSVSVNKD